jgi:hypothetical protein
MLFPAGLLITAVLLWCGMAWLQQRLIAQRSGWSALAQRFGHPDSPPPGRPRIVRATCVIGEATLTNSLALVIDADTLWAIPRFVPRWLPVLAIPRTAFDDVAVIERQGMTVVTCEVAGQRWQISAGGEFSRSPFWRAAESAADGPAR